MSSIHFPLFFPEVHLSIIRIHIIYIYISLTISTSWQSSKFIDFSIFLCKKVPSFPLAPGCWYNQQNRTAVHQGRCWQCLVVGGPAGSGCPKAVFFLGDVGGWHQRWETCEQEKGHEALGYGNRSSKIGHDDYGENSGQIELVNSLKALSVL